MHFFSFWLLILRWTMRTCHFDNFFLLLLHFFFEFPWLFLRSAPLLMPLFLLVILLDYHFPLVLVLFLRSAFHLVLSWSAGFFLVEAFNSPWVGFLFFGGLISTLLQLIRSRQLLLTLSSRFRLHHIWLLADFARTSFVFIPETKIGVSLSQNDSTFLLFLFARLREALTLRIEASCAR